MRHAIALSLIALLTGQTSAQVASDLQVESLSTFQRVIDVTRLGFGTAIRVNRTGQVLVVTGADLPANLAHRTFIWSKPSGLTEITFGGDFIFTRGTDLSDTGYVVGEALSPRGFYEPFVWTAAAGIRLLSEDLIIEVSSPSAVNDIGEVVGSRSAWQASYRSGLATGFFYGNPLGVRAGPCVSSAMDISRWGDSVGGSTYNPVSCADDGEPTHAYVLRRNGSVTDLGTLGGANSQAVAVNDLGQVVGWSETATGSMRAFLWSPATGMVNIGTLGGNWSQALGLNNHGDVVGISRTPFGYMHAFAYSRSTGMVSMGRGVPESINDLRQVVGTETRTGTSVAFAWSPLYGRTNIAHNARALHVNNRGQVAGARKALTPPPDATVWQLAVTPAETLEWYGARVSVRFYGHFITKAQADTYARWIDGARDALTTGDQALLDLYLGNLRSALGRP